MCVVAHKGRREVDPPLWDALESANRGEGAPITDGANGLLRALNLNGTAITSLQGMPPLPTLSSLDLHGTGIMSVRQFPTLPTLT